MQRFILLLLCLIITPACAEAQEAVADKSFHGRIAAAALKRTEATVRYDPAYVAMKYPGGDVPADTGVCTDVVIRTLRAVGIDLQKEVHVDMKGNFAKYPKNWGAKRPDKNIDHRRVPNLQRYFKRHGAELPITKKAADYRAGDLVAWDLNDRGLWHIGVVVEKAGKPWIVHNIGSGPVLQDCLFDFKIVGHYRLKE